MSVALRRRRRLLPSAFSGAAGVVNLLTAPLDFSDAAWTSGLTSRTQNAADPSGAANSAWTLEDNDAALALTIEQTAELVPTTDPLVFTMSMAKRADNLATPVVQITYSGGVGALYRVQFDLLNGAASEQADTTAGSTTTVTANGATFFDISMALGAPGVGNSNVSVIIYPVGNDGYPRAGIKNASIGTNVFYSPVLGVAV